MSGNIRPRKHKDGKVTYQVVIERGTDGNGIPIKVMSENLGHANTGVTMDTYSHVTPKMKEEVADKFDDELFSKIG